MLCLLRNIAISKKGPPGKESQYFDEAVTQLRNNATYKSNIKLQRWIEGTWLSCYKRWVYAYREKKYNICLNTNNGVESQNKLFKSIYLPRATGKSLSSIATVIVNNYLPDQHKQYIIKNIKMNASHKQYREDIPDFLHGRPTKFVKHCLTRITNADDLEGHVATQDLQKLLFKVRSSSGPQDYMVNVAKPHCDCQDWRRYKLPCKHMFAIFRWVEGVNWYSLPSSYISSPHISVDNESISEFKRPIDSMQTNSQEIEPTNTPSPTEDIEHVENNDDDFNTQLPIKTKKSIKSLAVRARTAIRSIQDLTYLIKDKAALENIIETASTLEKEIKATIKDESGLLVGSSPQKKKKRQRKTKRNTKLDKIGTLKKYQPPTKKQHHWRHRNRVGRKADMLRKTFKVDVPIDSPEMSTPQDVQYENNNNNDEYDDEECLLTSIFESPSDNFLPSTSAIASSPKRSKPMSTPQDVQSENNNNNDEECLLTSIFESPSDNSFPSISSIVSSPKRSKPISCTIPDTCSSTAVQPNSQQCSRPLTTSHSDVGLTMLSIYPMTTNWIQKYTGLINRTEMACLKEGEKLNDLIIDASLE